MAVVRGRSSLMGNPLLTPHLLVCVSEGSVWAGRVIPVKTYNPQEEQILQHTLRDDAEKKKKTLVGRIWPIPLVFLSLFQDKKNPQNVGETNLTAAGWRRY